MARTYKRKTDRASWSEEALRKSILAITNDRMPIKMASRTFGIPRRTIQHRLKNKNLVKGTYGRSPTLGHANEKKLVSHLKYLERHGFPLTMTDVRRLAFTFAEKNNLKHTFNVDKEKAGYDWLYGFLKRNPDLSVRKAENLSYARAKGMNKDDVGKYFKLLDKVLTSDDDSSPIQPSHIFNADETGLQLIYKAGKVVAEKGKKDVVSLTTGEKGETVSVMGCMSASGVYIPPFIIFKGVRNRPEFKNDLLPGSTVVMSESGYMKDEQFMKWLHHFKENKPPGKVVLILDGHSTHFKNIEAANFCNENNIIMLCLPPHSTHYLQPLDRSVYRSLKVFWNEECGKFVRNNPDRKITKHVFGKLFSSAWGRTATVQNALSGFKACGIHPLDPDAIPEHAFLPSLVTLPRTEDGAGDEGSFRDAVDEFQNEPGSSGFHPPERSVPTENVTINSTSSQSEHETSFEDLCPLPRSTNSTRPTNREKQTSVVLTSREHIQRLKEAKARAEKRMPNRQFNKPKIQKTSKNKDDFCAKCNGYYYDKVYAGWTWIQCQECGDWLHEKCANAFDAIEFICSKCSP